jgi:predicted nucleotidyltransferase
MNRTTIPRRKNAQSGVYFPHLAPLSAIQRFARQIVERFQPEKIILFGSYACGTATPHSDVDLLVVMPTRNQVEQAVRIDEAIEERGFPLDLLVRTPKALAKQICCGDCFMQEIVARGKVLYEKDHAALAAQRRKRRRRRSASPQAQRAEIRRRLGLPDRRFK